MSKDKTLDFEFAGFTGTISFEYEKDLVEGFIIFKTPFGEMRDTYTHDTKGVHLWINFFNSLENNWSQELYQAMTTFILKNL